MPFHTDCPSRASDVRVRIVVCPTAAIGVSSISGLTFAILDARARREVAKQTAERVDAAVAEKVSQARARMQIGEWDAAIALLEEAIATKDATDIGGATRLLAEAKTSKTKLLLESAQRAVQEKDIDEDTKLFRAFVILRRNLPKEGAIREAERLVDLERQRQQEVRRKEEQDIERRLRSN
jgi:hypothetical protein